MSDAEKRPRGAGGSAGFLLWHVELRWKAAMTQALAPLGLTHVQFAMLAAVLWLTEEEKLESIKQSDVAEHSGSDPMMTSQVLRVLEDRKLLARKPGAVDRRARHVVLLAAGRRLAKEALGVVRRVDHEFFERVLDDPERFRADLTRLAKAAGAPPRFLDPRS